jgi:ParB family transcriptional regulator, chromosome partitioning protein
MNSLLTAQDFFGAVPIEPEKPKAFAGLTSGKNDDEWYTPRHVIELARKALGGIDLDPASCALAQQTVRAGAYYDKHANGLERPWFGKVWMNPPYSRGLMAKFVGRLLHQYELGNIEAGIMLVHNCSETAWFQISGAGATRICFPKGRVDFRNPARTIQSTPGRGQSLLYYGPDPKRFDEVFGGIGLVMASAAP